MSAAAYYNSEPQSQTQPDRGYQPPQNGFQQNYPQTGYQHPPYPPPNQQQGGGGGYIPPNGPPPTQPQPTYNMKPSQPYAPPPPQNNNYVQNNPETNGQQPYGDTAPFSQANEKTGARFAPKKRLNDPIFLVLFIGAIAGFAVVSGLAISTFINVNGLGGGFGTGSQGGTGTSVTLDYHSVYLLLMVCALGLALAAVYLSLVRAFTKIIMEVTLALTVVLNIGICIYYFIIKYWSGAIIFLIIAIISVLSYWFMRKRQALRSETS